jgi:hypothetical protein
MTGLWTMPSSGCELAQGGLNTDVLQSSFGQSLPWSISPLVNLSLGQSLPWSSTVWTETHREENNTSIPSLLAQCRSEMEQTHGRQFHAHIGG